MFPRTVFDGWLTYLKNQDVVSGGSLDEEMRMWMTKVSIRFSEAKSEILRRRTGDVTMVLLRSAHFAETSNGYSSL